MMRSLSDIVRQVLPVILERTPQPVAKPDPRLPPEHRPNASEVGVVVADVDAFSIGRVAAHLEVAAAVHFNEKFREISKADDTVAAEIEDLAVGLARRGRDQKGVYRVVDIGE